ncbi:MAG: AFG1/ZapE family ATPase [Microbacteriaceae bacterium]
MASVDQSVELRVNGFPVQAVVSENTALFTFAELCEKPIGVREYLWLAKEFEQIRIMDVPDLAEVELNPLMRFCNLIDVLYDYGTHLDVLAAVLPERMREAKGLPRDAGRALSRLATLQSVGEDG